MRLDQSLRDLSSQRTASLGLLRPAVAKALLVSFLSIGAACHAACRSDSPGLSSSAQAKEAPAPAAEPIPGKRVATAGRALSVEEAHKLMPRADLSGLTPEQMGQLFEIAGDTFDYAGCNSTLAACLREDIKDKHAPRMAALAAMLIRDGHSAGLVVEMLERYYAAFAQAKRVKVRSDDCGTMGPAKAPVVVVEFSDYQCPHCAVAAKPLQQMVEKGTPNVRLCSKYFPLSQHPRSQIAASAAEYARSKGKFWPLSDLLFEHQEELEDASLKAYAKQVGLDGNDMLKQAYSGKYDALIESHKAEGNASALRATPTFFFNGRLYTLPARIDYLLFSVDDELEWQRASGAWEKE